MFNMRLYYGLVISNDDRTSDDLQKLSRVKVRILPEMKDVEESLLPWARPFITDGMTSTSFSHNTPEVGSKIWIIVLDEFFKEIYYLSGSFIDGLFSNIDTTITTINSIPELDTGDYKDLKLKAMPDGSILFYNALTGAMGIYHKSGSYTVFDKDGEITVSGGQVTITGGTLTVEGTASIDPVNPGPFCALPSGQCLFTGAKITGNEVTGT